MEGAGTRWRWHSLRTLTRPCGTLPLFMAKIDISTNFSIKASYCSSRSYAEWNINDFTLEVPGVCFVWGTRGIFSQATKRVYNSVVPQRASKMLVVYVIHINLHNLSQIQTCAIGRNKASIDVQEEELRSALFQPHSFEVVSCESHSEHLGSPLTDICNFDWRAGEDSILANLKPLSHFPLLHLLFIFLHTFQITLKWQLSLCVKEEDWVFLTGMKYLGIFIHVIQNKTQTKTPSSGDIVIFSLRYLPLVVMNSVQLYVSTLNHGSTSCNVLFGLPYTVPFPRSMSGNA